MQYLYLDSINKRKTNLSLILTNENCFYLEETYDR